MIAARTFFIPFVLIAGALADIQQRDTEAGQLLSRQSGVTVPDLSSPESIAPECKSTCDSLQANVQGCQDFKCLCTDGNSDAYGNCFSCFATHTHDVNITSQFQEVMDSFVEACKSDGITVKSQTIRSNGALSVRSTVGAIIIGLVIFGVFSMF